VLAAEPQMLGMLRPLLPTALMRGVTLVELARDLSWHASNDPSGAETALVAAARAFIAASRRTLWGWRASAASTLPLGVGCQDWSISGGARERLRAFDTERR
jgi:hypothetical protein